MTWGAGGGADAMARQLGSLSQPLLGVALPASNVPGASGNTGLAQVLSGKPDGYTLATYIQDTLMTLPMGLARYKVDDLEWITRTQVADSFLFVAPTARSRRSRSCSSTRRPIRASCAWAPPASARSTT